MIKMGEVEGIKYNEIRCPRCGRYYPALMPDCPFCDTRYKVVKGQ
jgi:uncharacterized Zn-finger protein